jgi:SAM-dependent methyltransferase
VEADWLDMALPPRSRDLVVSDGCFGVLRYPDQYHRVLRKVHEVLRPQGRFAFRVFARPAHPEEPADVYRALLSGAIGSFHAFKLRLLMAVQRDSRAGVAVGDVWQSWHRDGPATADLAAVRGWPIEQIETIEAYRGLDNVYTFPTLAELRSVIEEEGYDEIGCTWQRYELGERCPTLVLARR